jgi:hypothetical protein
MDLWYVSHSLSCIQKKYKKINDNIFLFRYGHKAEPYLPPEERIKNFGEIT